MLLVSQRVIDIVTVQGPLLFTEFLGQYVRQIVISIGSFLGRHILLIHRTFATEKSFQTSFHRLFSSNVRPVALKVRICDAPSPEIKPSSLSSSCTDCQLLEASFQTCSIPLSDCSEGTGRPFMGSNLASCSSLPPTLRVALSWSASKTCLL